jgi:regulator of protease activity HflC (stomatin/prohibitin superfamily)
LKISEINKAEGKKQASILRAEGEADAINLKAIQEKEGLRYLNEQIYNTPNGETSMKYILRHRYLDEYSAILANANVRFFLR